MLPDPYAKPRGNTCYKCRQQGHTSSSCPNKSASRTIVVMSRAPLTSGQPLILASNSASTTGSAAHQVSAVTTNATVVTTAGNGGQPYVGQSQQSQTRTTTQAEFQVGGGSRPYDPVTYPWGLPPGYTPPYESVNLPPRPPGPGSFPWGFPPSFNPLYEPAVSTSANTGQQPWVQVSGINPLFEQPPTSAPATTVADVSWQDLNNDVDNIDDGIGRLGRRLENCFTRLDHSLNNGLGQINRNFDSNFGHLNQNMGVQSDMMNAWLRWFQTGTGTPAPRSSQSEGSRVFSFEPGQGSQTQQVPISSGQAAPGSSRPPVTAPSPNLHQQYPQSRPTQTYPNWGHHMNQSHGYQAPQPQNQFTYPPPNQNFHAHQFHGQQLWPTHHQGYGQQIPPQQGDHGNRWQPIQNQQPLPQQGFGDQNRPVLFNEVQNLVEGMVGDLRQRVDRPTYTKPYPPYVDQVPLPHRYHVPTFHLFSGEAYQSTVEHIGRFISQCGEANSEENRMQLFVNSLTGPAFSWFVNLPPNSIQTWRDLERAFHDRFHKAEQNIPVAELAKSFQTSNETAQEYIGRFKLLRTRCKAQLPESEFVEMALAGLGFEFRKKFEGLTFRDLYELESRVLRYDTILREEMQRKLASKGTYYTSQAVGAAHVEEWSSDDDMAEVNAAELAVKRPFVCKALEKTELAARSLHNNSKTPPRTYTFDIRKADLIFDQLLAAKLIKLSVGHVIPPVEQMKGKLFCKFHNSWKHSTNNCVIFRDIVQDLIDQGKLKFPDMVAPTMKVDTDPFPTATVNMVNVGDHQANDSSVTQKDLSAAEGVMVGSIKLSPSRLTVVEVPPVTVLCGRCQKELGLDEVLRPKKGAEGKVEVPDHGHGISKTSRHGQPRSSLQVSFRETMVKPERIKRERPVAAKPTHKPIRRRLSYDSSPPEQRVKDVSPRQHSSGQDKGKTPVTYRSESRGNDVERRPVQNVRDDRRSVYNDRRPRTYRPPITNDNRWYGRMSRDHDIAPLSKTQKRRHQREVALAKKFESTKQDGELKSFEKQDHRNGSSDRLEKEGQHRQHRYQHPEQKERVPKLLVRGEKNEASSILGKKFKPSGSSEERVAAKVEQVATESSPVGRQLVEVLRNKLPPFAPEGWAAMKEYHKTYSALALYGPTWEELDTLRALADNPQLEPLMVQSTSSAGLKILYQARLDGVELFSNKTDLPVSSSDLKYLKGYHRMYSVISTYGVTSQERGLLLKMDERIHKREMEYAAEVKKNDSESSEEEIADMDVDDSTADQKPKLLGINGKASRVFVQDQFCIDDEQQMIEVAEQEVEPSEARHAEDLMIDHYESFSNDLEGFINHDARITSPTKHVVLSHEIENIGGEEEVESSTAVLVEGEDMTVGMVFVLPIDFLAQPDQPQAIEGDVTDVVLPTIAVAEQSPAHFPKPTPEMVKHIKPLYITACFEGYPISKVLVDGGAAVNVIPMSVVSKLKKTDKDILPADLAVYDFSGSKKKTLGVIPLEVKVGSKSIITGFYVINADTTYSAILGRDWIHKHMCIPSTLHQMLLFWNEDEVEVVRADDKPFKATANVVEAAYYDELVGPSEIRREDNTGRITGVTMRRMISLGAETVFEDSERPALAKLFDSVINE